MTKLPIKYLMISLLLIFSLMILFINNKAVAGSRFTSASPCVDAGKYCVSSGMRKVQGFEVHRDCCEWAYSKKCNYPSKNDCAQHAKCYSLGQRDCILRDSLGNCVNIKKEFSCKRWTPVVLESETVRYGTEDKDGIEGLICEGVPCIDGNCMDKSYQMDADMVSSVAQLGALSQGKNTIAGFKIFEGLGRNCSKKAAGYQSCCHVKPKGWGKQLGSKCSKDEEILAEKRQKNLCIYVGKAAKKTAGVTTFTKHHYCCFSNMLEKVVQIQARKQLGLNFGSGGSPNCRGLTLEELAKIDFSKMDFSEVAAEMMQKLAMPNISDVKGRIDSSFKNSNTFDKKHEAHPKNKSVGVNSKLKEEE
jgi:conjugal transfer mating pair stabilization protein TraN